MSNENTSPAQHRSAFLRGGAGVNGHQPSQAAGTEGGAGDITSLPLFAATRDSNGRERSDFALRPLVPINDRHDDTSPARSLDWETIRDYRDQVSSLLTARIEKEGGHISDEARAQLGVAVISDLLRAEAQENVSAGRAAWSATEERELSQTLFNALFGLGRLQPLVDDDSLENIIIRAKGTRILVWLEKTDGTLVPGPPIADSEDELREFLADLGGRQNRPFSEARPSLHLRLPGGARLAAASWVTAETSVVIRRHRLVKVTMEQMVHERGACTPILANFLASCVSAGKSIVVSGVQGSGKTTWVRALCSCIPTHEMIGTFETEFELHLHEMHKAHPIVHAWEHRPGSGEIGIGGRQAGEFSLEEAIHDSFRFTLDRQIVGEVRGPEVWNMLKAMESGPGSISTTHARSAEHTIEKLVSCAMEMGPQVTRELAISKLSAAVDVVVYLRSEVTDNGDGTMQKHRWVEEVLVVEPSPDAARGYATTTVFRPIAGRRAVATGEMPDKLRDELARNGFDMAAYTGEADQWRVSP